MKFAHFFIQRPIFASMLSLLILIVGSISLFQLPVSEYPEVVPPTVVVTANYPGANPKIIAETVATPLEQEINGTENMLYMFSQATSDGRMTLTVTFALGTDLDKAQVQVQNRVNSALPRLPQTVQRLGVVAEKASPDLTMVVHIYSPDNSREVSYLANYSNLYIKDDIARLGGVGDVQLFGGGEYSMRLWLDPDALASRNLTAMDVVNAVRQQNQQVAAGSLGAQPSTVDNQFQVLLNVKGRLENIDEFNDIIVQVGDNGALTRLKDVARIELGQNTYALRALLNGNSAVAMPIFQRPGANAIELSNEVRDTMAELSKKFPQGVSYEIAYDPTVFVRVTISTIISAINSLTLSPALSALLLKEKGAKPDRLTRILDAVFGRFLFKPFNKLFDYGSNRYEALVKKLVRFSAIVVAAYLVLLGGTGSLFNAVPGGFIPQQDKQYLVAIAQLPDAASLDRTEEVIREMETLALATPGVSQTISFPGLSVNGFTNSPNSGIVFVTLDAFENRTDPSLGANAIVAALNQKFAVIDEAFVAIFPPPPIQGLGSTGGFKLQIEDRGNKGFDQLFQQLNLVIQEASKRPELMGLYSTFRIQVPQMDINVDREQAMLQGIPLEEVFNALQVYLGSLYVNDFNMFGRTYQVNAQADIDYRLDPEQILSYKVRSASGKMVPLGAVLEITPTIGPDRVMHYNGYPSAELNGSPAFGYSSDEAQKAIEDVLAANLSEGMVYEWTDVTYQQILAGNTMVYIFPLVVLLVFMVLAAQYESLKLPLAIILIVPMTIFSALGGVWLVGGDNNIFTQIALIVLVALACKNAILMVEFANELKGSGKDHLSAILEACRLRLRPILMTSIAFTAGVVPLVLGSGAGAEMRQAMGIAVFSGMVGVTFFGLLLTPVFYMLVSKGRKQS